VNLALLDAEKQHLAGLLEAIQRCVYYLNASDSKIDWPIESSVLEERKMDSDYFESLAAINERFAKLQDVLGAAMKHSLLLLGEASESFLRVLSAYEKLGILESIASWQLCRTARNLSAHDYETQYQQIATHFNTLHELQPFLYQTARRLIAHCEENLKISPASPDFSKHFDHITRTA
jgi:hypothetical protein